MLDQKQFTLKQLRGLAEMSQEELAEKIGVTARTIGAYESNPDNLRKASYQKLRAIAEALDVSVDNIFLG